MEFFFLRSREFLSENQGSFIQLFQSVPFSHTLQCFHVTSHSSIHPPTRPLPELKVTGIHTSVFCVVVSIGTLRTNKPDLL